VFFPWTLKPVYGLISDAVPIFRYRRRPYLVVCPLIYASTFMYLAVSALTPVPFVATSVVSAVFACFSEVVVDSIAVEFVKSRDESKRLQEVAKMQSACMLAKSMGALTAAGCSIALMTFVTPRQILILATPFPVIASMVAFWISEQRVSPVSHLCAAMCSTTIMLTKLKALFVHVKKLYKPMLFFFIYNSVPSAADAYSTFLYDTFSFANWQFSLIKLIGLFAAVVAVLVYFRFLTNVAMVKLFVIATCISVLSGVSELLLATGSSRTLLHIPDYGFISADTFIVSFSPPPALMPGIVLAALECPKGAEGTVFALFSSIAHVGALVSSAISIEVTLSLGVTKTSWDKLWLLILICQLLKLLPLLLITLLLRVKKPSKPSTLGESFQYQELVSSSPQTPHSVT